MPSALLPRDEPRDGFDNIAAALQVTPSFLDQYISAARTVVVQAMGNKDALPAGTTYRAQKPSTQLFHQDGLPLGTRGGIAVDHNFPADGEYVLNIANMAQALWVYNMEFENHLVVTLDGKLIYETSIGGEDDMKAIDQKQDPAVEAINQRLKNIKFTSKAGVHHFVVAFKHRTFAESEDRLQMYAPGGGQDRVLRVSSFEIRGPYNATGVSETASRRQIFAPCYPKNAAEEEPCAQQVISTIARRAFRRPVTDHDMQGLMKLLRRGPQDRRLRRGRAPRAHGSAGASGFPVPCRCARTNACAGHHLSHGRPHAWPRACRSSCGAACRTTSCCEVAGSGKLHEPEELRARRSSACWPIRARSRWPPTSARSG